MFRRGTQCGRSTTPYVKESAVSLCRPVLPEVMPRTDALTASEAKVEVLIPCDSQFFLRVPGTSPWATKFLSQGSCPNSKVVEGGRKSSVMAGARMETVRLPRNCRSCTGAQ